VPARIERLTRDHIAREALRLIDEEGLQALTMRRLATRIDVGAMSLYNHVSNKQALLADVVDAVLAEVDVPRPGDGDWREAVRAILTSARRAILRHPAAVPLLIARQPTTAAALEAMDAGIGAIIRGGFEPATAARVHRCMASYLLGYVSLELSGFLPGESAELDLPDPEQLAAAYPYLAAAAPHLTAYDADADFVAGLNALLEGLARKSSASDGALRTRQPAPSPSGAIVEPPE
jgi:TetR/AcrR family transcriptional regulator, tetracycline repressor protein